MRRWINPLDGSRLDTGLARGERSVETVGRLADDVGATPPARRRRLAPFPRASARLDAQRTNAAPRTTSIVKAVRLQVGEGRYYVFEDAVERIRRRVVSLFRRSRWFIRVVVVYSSEIAHGYLGAPRKNAGDEMLPLKNCWVQAMIGKRLLPCGSTEPLFYVTTGQ